MKIEPAKTAAFSGHRTPKIAGAPSLFPIADTLEVVGQRLEDALRRAVADGYTTFLSGMAEGFDLAAAEAVLRMRDGGAEVKLVAVVPFRGQAAGFADDVRARYYEVIRRADRVEMLHESYFAGCFHRRNDFLVENASRLICYYNGAEGGTRYTVRRAQQAGLEVANLFLPEE